MDTTTPKPFIFVLMPFDSLFGDIYELGIKAACKDAGGYCERVDEQIFDESILERVYNQIAKADLLIADMTGRNPNVFYEVGYAHALGKKPILLTQKSEDIPFDLKHYPHIVYGGKITDLKAEIEKRVRFALSHPKQSKALMERRLQFRWDSQSILAEQTIDVKNQQPGYISTILEVHNSTEKRIETASFQLGFLTKNDINLFTRAFRINIINDKDKNLYILDHLFQILPGGWETCEITLGKSTGFNSTEIIQFMLRTFDESGTQDYPVNLRVL